MIGFAFSFLKIENKTLFTNLTKRSVIQIEEILLAIIYRFGIKNTLFSFSVQVVIRRTLETLKFAQIYFTVRQLFLDLDTNIFILSIVPLQQKPMSTLHTISIYLFVTVVDELFDTFIIVVQEVVLFLVAEKAFLFNAGQTALAAICFHFKKNH